VGNDQGVVSYRPSKRVTFPLKLMDMLSRPDLQDKVLTWSDQGTAWRVIDSKALEVILPQYFKHSSYLSFSRQVQLWGFTRINDGLLKGFYYHKMFLRENPSLCKWIQRVVKKTSLTKTRPGEPDFYKMGNVENDPKVGALVASVIPSTTTDAVAARPVVEEVLIPPPDTSILYHQQQRDAIFSNQFPMETVRSSSSQEANQISPTLLNNDINVMTASLREQLRLQQMLILQERKARIDREIYIQTLALQARRNNAEAMNEISGGNGSVYYRNPERLFE